MSHDSANGNRNEADNDKSFNFTDEEFKAVVAELAKSCTATIAALKDATNALEAATNALNIVLKASKISTTSKTVIAEGTNLDGGRKTRRRRRRSPRRRLDKKSQGSQGGRNSHCHTEPELALAAANNFDSET